MTWARKRMTLKVLLEPRDCPRCGRYMDRDFLVARRREQNKRARDAIIEARNRGDSMGKPRSIDWDRIKALRECGLSYGETAIEMKCSIAQVRYVCKKLGIIKIESEEKPRLRAFDRSGHRPWLEFEKERKR